MESIRNIMDFTRDTMEAGESLDDIMSMFRRIVVVVALEKTDWHFQKAAALLGVHRNTFTRIAMEYGLNGKEIRKCRAMERRAKRDVEQRRAVATKRTRDKEAAQAWVNQVASNYSATERRLM